MNNLNVAKIQLNGNSYEINNGTNLNELLNKLKIQKNKVAIEVNGEIIEKNKLHNKIIPAIFCRNYVYVIKSNVSYAINISTAKKVLQQ